MKIVVNANQQPVQIPHLYADINNLVTQLNYKLNIMNKIRILLGIITVFF